MKAEHISLLFVAILASGCVATTTESVEIIEVIDGDTVDIRYPNGSEDRVRLIGVDTPETRGQNSPEEFGLSDTSGVRSCLRKYGENASEYVSRFEGAEINVLQDNQQRTRGGYGRKLAYIYVGNNSRSLNQVLLEKGLARVYYSEFAQLNSFMESERSAKTRDIGIWSCS